MVTIVEPRVFAERLLQVLGDSPVLRK